MRIRNNRNKANYVNFKDNGFPRKVIINAGATVEISSLNELLQIINYRDFNRGFFEVIEKVQNKKESQNQIVETKKATKNKKDKEEDSLKKIEKEVRDYTDKE